MMSLIFLPDCSLSWAPYIDGCLSFHNFHEELLNEGRLRLDIVTTVERDSRVAGIPETLRAVIKKGQTGVVVDDRLDSFVATDTTRLIDF
jgi:hypothetical protein